MPSPAMSWWIRNRPRPDRSAFRERLIGAGAKTRLRPRAWFWHRIQTKRSEQ